MTEEQNPIKKPSLFWLMTEASRAVFEYGTFFPYNFLKKQEETGDGHAVLVLPGFMATDVSTQPLRRFLKKIGYQSYGWDIGRNYANEDYVDLLLEKVEDIYKVSGEPISIIGWSLGGVFARQIAKKRPHLIRQIITLGSPFRGINLPNNAAWIYKFITNGKSAQDIDPLLLNDIPNPAPVPTTAIYSKEDGVVPWQTCMEQQESNIHQNVQVRGSHFGLGVNPSVLEIIADRLQYSEAIWAPFSPETRIQEMMFYPSM
ncbi:MAG: hypothetical protein P8M34_09890 [Saprospiraceae bacterium]|nr:hypothetical protein [Saprospiraceae bacterium]|tara:strand:- start:65 stop:841 length:777 start_codon:yes stop_codon:yes gene_type:complete